MSAMLDRAFLFQALLRVPRGVMRYQAGRCQRLWMLLGVRVHSSGFGFSGPMASQRQMEFVRAALASF